jgi:histidyl-tRNA synthetase
MSNIQSLRGMKDIYGDEAKKFTYFIDEASKIAKKFGFGYFEAPLLEETALFKRSVGESSDIVGKEMYQFIDKGENDVSLRPEGTAGVVRSFIQNKFDKAGGTYRYFYHGAMFRYERPQKGRLREFHQFGCESFGVDSVYEDASVIVLISEILKKFGIKYKLLLNTLGCIECMPQYREKLVEYLNKIEKQLCSDCQRRISTNPIRVLDCKSDSCQELLKDAPRIVDNVCQSCDSDFKTLQRVLEANSIDFTIDTSLVRGLDYYSKSAFEFVSDEIGAQSAIAGGGRYDRLVEFLGGKPTPAVGFAIGIERILDLIQMPESKQDKIYLGAMSDEALDKVFELSIKKREDTQVICEYKPRGFSKHLNQAQKQGCRAVALIGENELKNGTIWIKNFETKEETTISQEEF